MVRVVRAGDICPGFKFCIESSTDWLAFPEAERMPHDELLRDFRSPVFKLMSTICRTIVCKTWLVAEMQYIYCHPTKAA